MAKAKTASPYADNASLSEKVVAVLRAAHEPMTVAELARAIGRHGTTTSVSTVRDHIHTLVRRSSLFQKETRDGRAIVLLRKDQAAKGSGNEEASQE